MRLFFMALIRSSPSWLLQGLHIRQLSVHHQNAEELALVLLSCSYAESRSIWMSTQMAHLPHGQLEYVHH